MSRAKKITVVGLGLVVLAGGSALVGCQTSNEESASSGAASGSSSAGAGASTTPPLETSGVVEPGPAVEVPTDEPVQQTGGVATVVLSLADWAPESSSVEAAGYVAGLVESGGTCTLTLTREGTSVTTATPAEPDASTTTCGALAVSGDQLAAGRWQAVLSYDSGTSSGTSTAVEVEVPAR